MAWTLPTAKPTGSPKNNQRHVVSQSGISAAVCGYLSIWIDLCAIRRFDAD